MQVDGGGRAPPRSADCTAAEKERKAVQSESVGADFSSLLPENKSPIGHAVSTRGGKVSGEVPVAFVIGNGGVKAFYALVYDADFRIDSFRGQEF